MTGQRATYILLRSLSDSLKGTDSRTLTDLYNKLDALSKLNVDLSTRASEATLSAIKTKTDNLDVLLSTRASEATLSAIKNALASVGTDKLRTSVVDTLPESPFNLTKVSGTTLTARDWSSDFAKLQNLDITLSTLPKYIRWGIGAEPSWLYGSEVTAPPANTALVSKTVESGKTGYVFGIFISAGEANDFKLNWVENGSAKSIRIPFSSAGALYFYDFKEMCKADGNTTITITNVNAGSSGVVYQAGILYAEV